MIADLHQRGIEPSDLIARLVALQNPDGGWGAAAGSISNSECTALASLALEASGEDSAHGRLRAGLDWLLERQHASGAWSYSEHTPLAPWPTPIVLLSLRGREDAAAARERGFEWLVGIRGVRIGLLTRLRLLFANTPPELDASLSGWPWAPDTFSWVEPTAWALMALKANWPADRPGIVRERILEGEALLLDRACLGGGWNYGNRQVFGEHLPPYPDTTALGLMALRGRADPIIEDSFHALDSLLGEHASVLSLSLAVLSRRAWARPSDALVSRLALRLHDDRPMDHRSLALAALAFASNVSWMDGSRNG